MIISLIHCVQYNLAVRNLMSCIYEYHSHTCKYNYFQTIYDLCMNYVLTYHVCLTRSL